MVKTYKYKSIGLELFDNWIISLVIFLVCLYIFWMLNFNFAAIFLSSFAIAAIFLMVRMLSSVSIIKRVNNRILFKDAGKEIVLDGVERSEGWWSYEFGGESTEFTGAYGGFGNGGRVKGHTNKINIYLRLSSNYKSVTLREQIHMSSKFPNNFPYKTAEREDEKNMFKVWDIDKCCEKLELGYLLNERSKAALYQRRAHSSVGRNGFSDR